MLCDSVDEKPVVNCSFVTEFEDHIFVAMDAEAVLFIHDLVINYVKEKDQGIISSSQTSSVCLNCFISLLIFDCLTRK